MNVWDTLNFLAHFLSILQWQSGGYSGKGCTNTSRKRGFYTIPLVSKMFEPRLMGYLVAVLQANRDRRSVDSWCCRRGEQTNVIGCLFGAEWALEDSGEGFG
jgi:hypothetical protein